MAPDTMTDRDTMTPCTCPPATMQFRDEYPELALWEVELLLDNPVCASCLPVPIPDVEPHRLMECDTCNEMAKTTDPQVTDVLAILLAADDFDYIHFTAEGVHLCTTALGERFAA